MKNYSKHYQKRIAELKAENDSLQADVQTLRHQAVHDVSQLGEQSAEIASLKAENEELHKDYEALADEHTKLIDRNARLQAEVERLRDLGIKLESMIDPLKAEVEKLENLVRYWSEKYQIANARFLRADDMCKKVMSQHSDISCENIMLRKAGDAMLALIKYEPGVNTFDPVPQVVKNWNAAKEGNQS